MLFLSRYIEYTSALVVDFTDLDTLVIPVATVAAILDVPHGTTIFSDQRGRRITKYRLPGADVKN